MRYLPLGYQPQTEEELKEQQARFDAYEFYGIPYGILDSENEEKKEEDLNIEIDRNEARSYILQNKPLPEDLAKRLLAYKEKLEN